MFNLMLAIAAYEVGVLAASEETDVRDCSKQLLRRECNRTPGCQWAKWGGVRGCVTTIDESSVGSSVVSVARVEYTAPWTVAPRQRDADCALTCEVETPYLRDGVCEAAEDRERGSRYCPEEVGAWDADDELEYEAILEVWNAERAMDATEVTALRALMSYRTAALRAAPWTNVPFPKVPEEAPRRRATFFGEKCLGGNGGVWRTGCYKRNIYYLYQSQYTNQSRRSEEYYSVDSSYCSGGITKVATLYHNLIIHIRIHYANGGVNFGGSLPTTGGKTWKTIHMPSCVVGVVARTGALVDGFQFIDANKNLTPWVGGSGGQLHYVFNEFDTADSYLVLGVNGQKSHVTSHKCLKKITMKTGTLVDRICFEF